MVRLCLFPRCHNQAPVGSYCRGHYEQLGLAAEARTRRAHYTTASWRVLRAAVLQASPWCVACGALATTVDHIVERRDGGTDTPDNLQPLCHACHSRKTALRTAHGQAASAARAGAHGPTEGEGVAGAPRASGPLERSKRPAKG